MFMIYVLPGENVYIGVPPPTLGRKEGSKERKRGNNLIFLIFQKEEMKKNIFIIFYQGEQLRLKIKKICDG